MTKLKDPNAPKPYGPMEPDPPSYKDLQPRSFDYFLDEVGASLAPIGDDRSTLDPATELTRIAMSKGWDLLRRAREERAAGRTELAWSFLAEAHGIAQRYSGFEEAKLFMDRVEISQFMSKAGKAGRASRSDQYHKATQKVVDSLIAKASTYSTPEDFKAAVVQAGLDQKWGDTRCTDLLKHPRIKEAVAAIKKKKDAELKSRRPLN